MWLLWGLSILVIATGANTNSIKYFLKTSDALLPLSLTENLDKMDPHLMTHFILHGWKESAKKPVYVQMASELNKYGKCNVVLVDFSYIFTGDFIDDYIRTTDVESLFTEFVAGLTKNYSFTLNLIHFIGHSMGAQVAGSTARRLFGTLDDKVGWITGLDPARPGYELPPVRRLTSADAKFVDIVHTDAGGYGYMNPSGNVDFFINNNGRRLQPGCTPVVSTSLHGLAVSLLIRRPDDNFCSHQKSVAYYIESITTRTLATQCDSFESYEAGLCKDSKKVVFGLHVPMHSNGVYYFNTSQDKKGPYLIPT